MPPKPKHINPGHAKYSFLWRLGGRTVMGGRSVPEGIMARKVRSIRAAELKAKVALAAVQSQQTTTQLATLPAN